MPPRSKRGQKPNAPIAPLGWDDRRGTTWRWPNDGAPPPADDKRSVKVKVYSFKGYSIGARHWTVEVEEEDNQLWDEDRGTWRRTNYDRDKFLDREASGKKLRADVFEMKQAVMIALTAVQTMGFINPGYSVRFDIQEGGSEVAEEWYKAELAKVR